MTDKNIHERLAEIQSTISVPKKRYNKFGDFYYRNYEDILEAVKPLLKGMVIIASDEIHEMNGVCYVKSTLTLSDGKDVIVVSAEAREELERPKMSPSQLTGSASSYARKYAANGMFALDDAQDPDSMNHKATVAPSKSQVLEGVVEKNLDQDLNGELPSERPCPRPEHKGEILKKTWSEKKQRFYMGHHDDNAKFGVCFGTPPKE